MLRTLAPTLALALALALPTLACRPVPALAQGTSSLAIDRAVKARGQRALAVFEAPSRTAAPVRLDGGGELLVSGVVSNVQGRWYEVVYPVHGWVREGDVAFLGPSGDYRPSQYPEEERIAMRLKSDVGVTPADWDSRLGRPWAGAGRGRPARSGRARAKVRARVRSMACLGQWEWRKAGSGPALPL